MSDAVKIGILIYNKGNKGGAERRYFHLIRGLSKDQTVFIHANSSVFDFWDGLGGFGKNVVRDVLIRDRTEVFPAAGGGRGKTGLPPGLFSIIGKAVPRRVKSSLPVYWSTLKLNWRVYRWSRRTGITHLNALQGAAILAVGARLNGCRIVFSYVDYMVENGYPFRWITNHGLKTVVRISGRYDFLSGMIPKRMMDKGLRIDESRIRIPAASFTDFDRFRPLARKKRKIVFTGRLEDIKNPFLALRVAETLKRGNVDFTMRILGRGRLTRPLEAYVESRRLKDRVRIGYTSAVEDELKDALVFLSLQKENNYPSQSLLEAMASGCVPIATDVGETRKIVDDEIGFLVPENAETIAEIIRGIFRKKSFYEGRSPAIRKRVETRFGAEQYLSYYRSLFEN
jgi:glycosyltransferase involved in cell wall biosynthesis